MNSNLPDSVDWNDYDFHTCTDCDLSWIGSAHHECPRPVRGWDRRTRGERLTAWLKGWLRLSVRASVGPVGIGINVRQYMHDEKTVHLFSVISNWGMYQYGWAWEKPLGEDRKLRLHAGIWYREF